MKLHHQSFLSPSNTNFDKDYNDIIENFNEIMVRMRKSSE